MRKTIFINALILILYGCATQVQPSGGDKDELPPKLVADENLLMANKKKSLIRLYFDENIVGNNLDKNIIINPQQEKLSFKTSIKRNKLEIAFDEGAIKDSITYSIYLGDHISDLNEGNKISMPDYIFSINGYMDTMVSNIDLVNLDQLPTDKYSYILKTRNNDFYYKKGKASEKEIVFTALKKFDDGELTIFIDNNQNRKIDSFEENYRINSVVSINTADSLREKNNILLFKKNNKRYYYYSDQINYYMYTDNEYGLRILKDKFSEYLQYGDTIITKNLPSNIPVIENKELKVSKRIPFKINTDDIKKDSMIDLNFSYFPLKNDTLFLRLTKGTDTIILNEPIKDNYTKLNIPNKFAGYTILIDSIQIQKCFGISYQSYIQSIPKNPYSSFNIEVNEDCILKIKVSEKFHVFNLTKGKNIFFTRPGKYPFYVYTTNNIDLTPIQDQEKILIGPDDVIVNEKHENTILQTVNNKE